MSSGGFNDLKAFAQAIDAEVEALEKEVFFGLRDVSNKSNFSADIADEVLEEVQGMKNDAEALAQKLTEAVSNLESLVKSVIFEAAEVEESVKQVEAHAAQYGYVPQERQTLEQAYDDFLASSNESPDDPHAEGEAAGTSVLPASAAKVSTNGRVDSPNLLTFGLSKNTLGKLGFRFKEDLEADGPDEPEREVGTESIPDNSSADVSAPTEPAGDDLADDSDDDFSPVSILKSRPAANLAPPEVSFVEISPGLVVRRPSTRITPKFQEADDDEDEDAEPAATKTRASPERVTSGSYVHPKTPERSVQSSAASPGGTPVMPTLKTFKWDPTVNITTKAPTPRPTKPANLPGPAEPAKAAPQSSKESLTGTPPTPDLRTLDVRKLLLQASANEAKRRSPEVSEPRGSSRHGSTPEFPELTTDLSKFSRSYRSDWQNNKENFY